MSDHVHHLQRAIKYVSGDPSGRGGVGKLADALKVGQSVVSNWLARRTLLDAVYCSEIERITAGEVRRWEVRPDDWHRIWPELVGVDGAPPVPSTTDTPAEA